MKDFLFGEKAQTQDRPPMKAFDLHFHTSLSASVARQGEPGVPSEELVLQSSNHPRAPRLAIRRGDDLHRERTAFQPVLVKHSRASLQTEALDTLVVPHASAVRHSLAGASRTIAIVTMAARPTGCASSRTEFPDSTRPHPSHSGSRHRRECHARRRCAH